MTPFRGASISSPTQTNETWPAILAIQTGLGDGVEWIGGIWMLVINVSLYRQRSAPRALSVAGVLTGVIGMLTLYPPLAAAGGAFGLLQIGWFGWLGGLLIKQKVSVLPA
ncbi:MAG: hypothetical protein CBB67_022390 [Alteromonadaceae bacterium TMED7]|nr:hypothetical protein [Alteromonadaceae bacterium]RPH12781.1 MAG: hypothetical protein CBB67_022390 [Alteromonadaceae bacterium TMED7]